MRRFQLPGRRVSHIVRTNSYVKIQAVQSLCGLFYSAEHIKPIPPNVLPCRSCNKLAKPGVNCDA